MRQRLIGVAAAVTLLAAAGQVWAQTAAPWPQPQWASVGPYPFNAPTPDDAYRQGLINRWEYEQFAGPMPQALQGPSVNGEKGDSDGGGRQ